MRILRNTRRVRVAGYGFSLARVPWRPEANYPVAMVRAVVDGFAHRWWRKRRQSA